MEPYDTNASKEVDEVYDDMIIPTPVNIHICNAIISEFRAENEELKKDYFQLWKTFKHTHVNSQDGTDACKECGLDLRNKIHFNCL